ncbi:MULTISPECIES: hypothetical protein [unclassified Brevundimonas]|jgi:hypothetical protein|uniref:hypothetical protein n=1 Tax=unclassified Brevundimonas TaxID=2622653 RepID=UPI0011F6A142|nr:MULTISPECIES: hypothetical protein [unclassified Brevundimonas]MBA3050431.1 hypothetical protein [Brevundimonas sp.]MBU2292496.1 hypothetical protein [Alphaproteobacteria bacterium]MBU2398736.1 hypothetical protein [Alphaproteobacteria bacterium]TAJ56889.1 MAG: hypothetical protein EPO49_13565 [Brevundimonas sp.]
MIGETGTEAGPGVPTCGDEDLLTRAEASAFLAQFGIRLKPSTLARLWSTGGGGPPCRHVRSRPHYPRGLLREWARSQITDVRTAAPPAARGRRRG